MVEVIHGERRLLGSVDLVSDIGHLLCTDVRSLPLCFKLAVSCWHKHESRSLLNVVIIPTLATSSDARASSAIDFSRSWTLYSLG